MGAVSPTVRSITTDERRSVSVDMSGLLAEGESLITPVAVQGDAALVVTDERINSAALEVNGVEVRPGAVVQFMLACAVPGRYSIEILCPTSEGQEVEGTVYVHVTATLHAS